MSCFTDTSQIAVVTGLQRLGERCAGAADRGGAATSLGQREFTA